MRRGGLTGAVSKARNSVCTRFPEILDRVRGLALEVGQLRLETGWKWRWGGWPGHDVFDFSVQAHNRCVTPVRFHGGWKLCLQWDNASSSDGVETRS